MLDSSRHILVYLLGCLLFLGCEEKSEWATTPDQEPTLVVEALLTNEFKQQEIRLSLSQSQINTPPTPVSDASLFVSANGNLFEFAEAVDAPGIYKSMIPFSVSSGHTHQLTINWEGKIYKSASTLSTVAVLPEITFLPAAGDSTKLRIVEDIPLYSEFEQAMYQFNIDWSAQTGDLADQAQVYLYTFSDFHINEVQPPTKEPVRFPYNSEVIVRKYGLDEEFARFLLAVQVSTTLDGNLFYSSSSSVPSNISNGGLGYFATCAVVTDTLVAGL